MTPLTRIVRNGKIEIPAPVEFVDGAEVTLLLIREDERSDDEGPMEEAEVLRTLQALEKFASEFAEDEAGEDLSRCARESAGWEKATFVDHAKKIGSLFD